MIKVAFSFKSKGTKKFELFSERTADSANLRYESKITIDYKYKKFYFCLLGCKVMAERR